MDYGQNHLNFYKSLLFFQLVGETVSGGNTPYFLNSLIPVLVTWVTFIRYLHNYLCNQ